MLVQPHCVHVLDCTQKAFPQTQGEGQMPAIIILVRAWWISAGPWAPLGCSEEEVCC